MATFSKRCEGKLPNKDHKPNFCQRLCQLICCMKSPPTAEAIYADVFTHDGTKPVGARFAGVYAKEKYKSSDGEVYDLPDMKPEGSNGSLGVGFGKVDFKQPETCSSSDPDEKTQAIGRLKPAQLLQNRQETSDGSHANKTWEQPVRDKINIPEQQVHKNPSQEDLTKEAINQNGM